MLSSKHLAYRVLAIASLLYVLPVISSPMSTLGRDHSHEGVQSYMMKPVDHSAVGYVGHNSDDRIYVGESTAMYTVQEDIYHIQHKEMYSIKNEGIYYIKQDLEITPQYDTSFNLEPASHHSHYLGEFCTESDYTQEMAMMIYTSSEIYHPINHSAQKKN